MGKIRKDIVKSSDFNHVNLGVPIYNNNHLNTYHYFYRYGYIDLYNSVTSTKEYVFFTKPDLNIFSAPGTLNPELQSYPAFQEAVRRYPGLLDMLQSSLGGSPFINPLTTLCKSALDMPSLDETDIDTSSTIYGDKITYRGPSFESDNNHEFTLEFSDDKYFGLYTLFRLWSAYNRLKLLGLVTPKKTYITNQILYDQVSAYKIIVDIDGETILYMAKLWGVYPKKSPRETFGGTVDNTTTLSVTFHAQWVDDIANDPLIIDDFKSLVSNWSGYPIIGSYNTKAQVADTRRVIMPDIIIDHKTRSRQLGFNYKLVWRGSDE